MTLIDYLDNVKDRETFIDFVWALIRDREETIARENAAPEALRGYGAYGWQNDTIGAYFEVALSCVDVSIKSAHNEMLTEPSWAAFADFLYVGMIYE